MKSRLSGVGVHTGLGSISDPVICELCSLGKQIMSLSFHVLLSSGTMELIEG